MKIAITKVREENIRTIESLEEELKNLKAKSSHQYSAAAWSIRKSEALIPPEVLGNIGAYPGEYVAFVYQESHEDDESATMGKILTVQRVDVPR